MTYRRLYVAAPQLLPVMDLLIADETNPRSAAFQLHWLARQSAQLPRDASSARLSPGKGGSPTSCSPASPASACNRSAALDPAVAAHRVATVCQHLVIGLEGYSELLTAHYFNHALPKVR